MPASEETDPNFYFDSGRSAWSTSQRGSEGLSCGYAAAERSSRPTIRERLARWFGGSAVETEPRQESAAYLGRAAFTRPRAEGWQPPAYADPTRNLYEDYTTAPALPVPQPPGPPVDRARGVVHIAPSYYEHPHER